MAGTTIQGLISSFASKPFLLYQLPEAFLLILAALGLLGIKPRPIRLLIAGFGLGILTGISRYFLFKFELLHTPIVLVGLVLSLAFGFKLSISTAVTGCFLSFFLLRMGESLLILPVLQWTHLTFQKTLENQWLYIIFAWLSASFLILATLICHLGHIALIRPPEVKDDIRKDKNDTKVR